MSSVAQFPSSNFTAGELSGAHSEKIAAAIMTLLAPLSPEEREQVLSKLTDMLRPIPAPRAGDVLGAIIKLLPQRRNWTVEELKTGVVKSGVEATPKEIYNAIGYLTRKGHIQRVGYGQYIVDGMAVVTSEELGGAPTLHEDGHRID
jgi:hypothetical protein